MQAGINLSNSKNLPIFRFSFKIATYSGKKGDSSKKAVNLCLLGIH